MKFSKMLAALTLSFVSLAAQATVVTQAQTQTVVGQDFVFAFTGLSKNFTGNGSITLTARGDYSPGWTSIEFITASAEGINFGDFGYDNAKSGTASMIAGNSDDTQWSRTFNLNHAQLNTLLADGVLNFNAFLGQEVNIMSSFSRVSVSFDYSPQAAVSVPEPGSMLLLGVAMAGLSLARRRKQ